jgi:hypothetical protein
MDESNSVPDPEEMDMDSVPDPHRDPLCSTCKHSDRSTRKIGMTATSASVKSFRNCLNSTLTHN